MNLDTTTIHLPGLIAQGTRKPWTGTLADLIRFDGDRMESKIATNPAGYGLPADWDGEETPWESLTLAHWRDLADDPNAELVTVANVALIPTHNDGLYDEPGIDLLHNDPSIPEEDRDSGEHIEWVPVGEWTDPQDEAGAPWLAIEEALAERGLRIVGEMDTWSASYAIARLERI